MIHQRFEWLDKAVLGEWAPFVVLPKQTVTKHLVFETRWDEPVIQENVHFELEMLTDTDKKWRKLAKWELGLSLSIWSELAEVGSSFGCNEVMTDKLHEASINPPDLHKYTGTKGPIPKDGFKAKPSYLDYNVSKSKRRKKA